MLLRSIITNSFFVHNTNNNIFIDTQSNEQPIGDNIEHSCNDMDNGIPYPNESNIDNILLNEAETIGYGTSSYNKIEKRLQSQYGDKTGKLEKFTTHIFRVPTPKCSPNDLFCYFFPLIYNIFVESTEERSYEKDLISFFTTKYGSALISKAKSIIKKTTRSPKYSSPLLSNKLSSLVSPIDIIESKDDALLSLGRVKKFFRNL